MRPEVGPRGAEQAISWSVRERESTESLLAKLDAPLQEKLARVSPCNPLAVLALRWQPPHLCGGGALQRSGKNSPL